MEIISSIKYYNTNRQYAHKDSMLAINPITISPYEKMPTTNDKYQHKETKLAKIVEDTGGDYLYEEEKTSYRKKHEDYTNVKDEIHLPQIPNTQRQSSTKRSIPWSKESLMVNFLLI